MAWLWDVIRRLCNAQLSHSTFIIIQDSLSMLQLKKCLRCWKNSYQTFHNLKFHRRPQKRFRDLENEPANLPQDSFLLTSQHTPNWIVLYEYFRNLIVSRSFLFHSPFSGVSSLPSSDSFQSVLHDVLMTITVFNFALFFWLWQSIDVPVMEFEIIVWLF